MMWNLFFFFLSLRILLCECLIKHDKECWNNSKSYEGRNNLRKFGKVSRILNRREERAKGRRQGGRSWLLGRQISKIEVFEKCLLQITVTCHCAIFEAFPLYNFCLCICITLTYLIFLSIKKKHFRLLYWTTCH